MAFPDSSIGETNARLINRQVSEKIVVKHISLKLIIIGAAEFYSPLVFVDVIHDFGLKII
jgi:hypothetical protein